MATLKDIAGELGLSVATVSRALNDAVEVSQATRARVREVAERLDYSPNSAAQKLVTGRTGAVGVVVPWEPGTVDPVQVQFTFGLSERLAAAGLEMVLHATTDPDPIAPYRRLIRRGAVDGFILTRPEINDARINFLREQKVPFVAHGRGHGSPDYAYHDPDNRAAAVAAVQLLADLGHRRIAYFNDDILSAAGTTRAEAFLATAAERGIAIPEHAIVDGVASSDAAYRAALALLSGHGGLAPTSVYCSSTAAAVGVWRAAADLGISVPFELSIVAFDDGVVLPQHGPMEMALTVTRVPLGRSCAPLVEAIVGRIARQPAKLFQTRTPAELIVRRSTAPVRPDGAADW